MNRHLKEKLRDQRGETIAETLVALLISALALVMLAGAIGAANRIITRSETQMQAYYEKNNDLATPTGSATTITITDAADKTIKLDKMDSITVNYSTNPIFAGKPVVAYTKQAAGGD